MPNLEEVEIDGSVTEEDDDFDILEVNFIKTNSSLAANQSHEINQQERDQELCDQSESSSDKSGSSSSSSSSESEDVEMKEPRGPLEVAF